MSSGDSNFDTVRDARKVVAKTAALFMKHCSYSDPKVLGAGSFGIVLRVRDPVREELAVKCVSLEYLREGEKTLWSGLLHPNIVPLLDFTEFRTINVACFVMHVYPCDLITIVKHNEFRTSSESLQKMKTWLHQVLCGLEFLHKRQLCHLDIKSDNIFISRHTSTAKIGDFSFLNRTPFHIGCDEIGLPRIYQPLESLEIKDEEFIDGRYFDMWSFGILTFELLTAFHIYRSFSCCYLGIEARNDSLRFALQEDVFINKIKIALPAVQVSHDDVQMALNFVHSFLKTNPATRMPADIGLHHKFLGKGDVANIEVDTLWRLPSATEGPIVDRHQNDDSILRERETNCFWRCCCDLQSLFTKCLPCAK